MAELPEHYGDDRMVALVRDPSNLFIYWDLEDGARRALEGELGAEALDRSAWVLRIVNLDTGGSRDIPIDLGARNWYVAVEAGCAYEVSLGLVDPDGAFHRVLAQGPVRTPPLSYSRFFDTQWMIPEEEYLKLLALGWTGFLGSSATSGFLPRETDTPRTAEAGPPESDEPAPTSPGVPEYRGRR